MGDSLWQVWSRISVTARTVYSVYSVVDQLKSLCRVKKYPNIKSNFQISLECKYKNGGLTVAGPRRLRSAYRSKGHRKKGKVGSNMYLIDLRHN